MAKLNLETTATRIYANYEAEAESSARKSNGIGISILGDECERKLWLGFRWALTQKFDGRMLRLFQYGKDAEPRLAKELEAAGVEIQLHDGNAGGQFRVEHLGGHISGYLDGLAGNVFEAPKTVHLVEMKTHNQKSFDALTSKGVQRAKPTHYAQMQLGMGLFDPPLTRALYVAENKNTSELYIERINFDYETFAQLKAKGERIVEAPIPPPTISNSANSYPCRFCHFKELCFQKPKSISNLVEPEKNCRTCIHSTPQTAGAWRCEFYNEELTKEMQEAGCANHLFIPDLLPYGAPVDATNERITYQHQGAKIENHAGGDILFIP